LRDAGGVRTQMSAAHLVARRSIPDQ